MVTHLTAHADIDIRTLQRGLVAVEVLDEYGRWYCAMRYAERVPDGTNMVGQLPGAIIDMVNDLDMNETEE